MESKYIVDTTYTEKRGSVEITYFKEHKIYEISLDNENWDSSTALDLTKDELIKVRDSINKILEVAPTE